MAAIEHSTDPGHAVEHSCGTTQADSRIATKEITSNSECNQLSNFERTI